MAAPQARDPRKSLAEIRAQLPRIGVFALVGAGILAGLFGGLAAYAGMWPPVLVVESGSMMHEDGTSEVGILDPGDLAIIQAVQAMEVATYLRGRATGYTSFGDYGDVIAFVDPEPNETAILIHRAFAYVTRNATGGFDVPDLAGIPRGEWSGVQTDGRSATAPVALREFTIQGMGWRHDQTIAWNLSQLGANSSGNGFLTFGDHNLYQSMRRTDPWILEARYIAARVRGEIPWLGLIRLTLARSPEGCCDSWGSTDTETGAPGNSWLALDVLLIVLFVTPVVLDLAWRRGWLARLWPWRKRPQASVQREDRVPESKDSSEPFPPK